MKRCQLAVQMYSFRDFIKTPEELTTTLRRIKDMGYGAIQYSPSMACMEPDALNRLLREIGLAVPTAHANAQAFCEQPETAILELRKFGCNHVAYPYPHLAFQSAAEAIACGKRLEQSARIFRAAGIVPAYHNHSIEFTKVDGCFRLDYILENAPSLEFEPDTYWIWRGGCDPVKWLRRFAGRASVVHLKDYGVVEWETKMMSVGDGALDWERILATCAEVGVQTYVVEQDGDVDDVFASFERSMQTLMKYIDR